MAWPDFVVCLCALNVFIEFVLVFNFFFINYFSCDIFFIINNFLFLFSKKKSKNNFSWCLLLLIMHTGIRWRVSWDSKRHQIKRSLTCGRNNINQSTSCWWRFACMHVFFCYNFFYNIISKTNPFFYIIFCCFYH